jgi:hypothetical protein
MIVNQQEINGGPPNAQKVAGREDDDGGSEVVKIGQEGWALTIRFDGGRLEV